MQPDLNLTFENRSINRQGRNPFVTFFNNLFAITYINGVPLHKTLLFLHDLFSGFIALYAGTFIYRVIYEPVFDSIQLYWVYLVFAPVFILFFKSYGLYQYQVILDKARHTSSLFKALFFTLMVLLLIAFVVKVPDVLFNRIYISTVLLVFLALFLLIRVVVIPEIFHWMVKTKLVNRNLLIIGTDECSIDKAYSLISGKRSYFNICGFVHNDTSSETSAFDGASVLGNINNLKEIVENHNIHDLLVCFDGKNEDNLYATIDECKKAGKPIHIVSSFYNVITQKLEVEEIGKISSFRVRPVTTARIYTEIKRGLDVLFSLLIILFLLPLWLVIATLIKIDSKGPLFYKPKMIGKEGKEFYMYKFRSMYHNSATQPHEAMVKKMILENRNTKKLKNDNRITPMGRVLRKISFDEFPQLINVLRGEMSLVGPRPCLPYEFELMKPWQKNRVLVKPGMTGLWQVKGRDEVLFNDQIVLDLYYIEHRSLFLDLEILLDTIPVVVFGKGGS